MLKAALSELRSRTTPTTLQLTIYGINMIDLFICWSSSIRGVLEIYTECFKLVLIHEKLCESTHLCSYDGKMICTVMQQCYAYMQRCLSVLSFQTWPVFVGWLFEIFLLCIMNFFFYWHFEFTLWQCWIEYQSWIKFQRWGTSIVSKACLQPYWSNFTTHLKIPLLFSWGLEGFARHPFLHFQGCQYLYYSSFPHVPSLPLYLSLPPSLPHLLPLVYVLWIPMVIIVNQGKQKILRWIFVSHKISYGGSNTKELLLSG